MAVTTDNKAIVAFKHLLGKSQTDSLKEVGNEAEGLFLNIPADSIFLEPIDPDPSVAESQGITVQVTADMTLDNTSNGHAFFAEWPATPPSGTDPKTGAAFAYGSGSLEGISAGDRVRNAISSSFGVGYEAKPVDTGAQPIPVLDPRDWIYQYNSGVFFQQDNVGDDPATIDVYVYIGLTLADTAGGQAKEEWQNSVVNRLATPPGLPDKGDRYLVIATATGDWVGQEDKIAEWNGTEWIFVDPTDGMSVKVDDEDNAVYHYEGTTNQWIREPLGQVRAGTAAGTDSYTVTVTPRFDGYVKDMVFLLSFSNDNTGTATLNVNSLGVKAIKKDDGTGTLVDLSPQDIKSGIVYMLVYDGTQFQLYVIAGSSASSNFGNKKFIEATDDITIQQNYQYLIYGDLTIEGKLTNKGEVTLVNGNIVVQGSGVFDNQGTLTLVTVPTGSSSILSKFSTTFSLTGGVAQTINHNLGTKDLVWNARSGNDEVDIQLTRIDDNNVEIESTSNVSGALNIIAL